MTDRTIHVTCTALHLFSSDWHKQILLWGPRVCVHKKRDIYSTFWDIFEGPPCLIHCWMWAHITNTSGSFLDWWVWFQWSLPAKPPPQNDCITSCCTHTHTHTKRENQFYSIRSWDVITEGRQQRDWSPELQRRWHLQLTSGVQTQNQELSCLSAKEASAKGLHRTGFE